MTVETIPNGLDWTPYVGLRSFGEEESDRFFGRYREANDIAALWQANRLTIVYGASGVGKTSLLRAGVVPLLEPSRNDVLPLGRVSHASAFPLAALPAHNPYIFALLSSWSSGESPTRLVGMTILEFLQRRGGRTDRYGDPIPVLAAIDQAEELFSDFAHRQSYRKPFFDDLAAALEASPDLHLLISLRADHLSEMRPYEELLGHRSFARFQLLPFSPANALEAARRPLAGTNRSFAPDAAEDLVEDLRTIKIVSSLGDETTVVSDTIEPVQLQVVCANLWESLPEDVRVIDGEQVRRYADVDRTLADFCERALAAVSADHDLPADRLRHWLIETFITELGTRGTAYEGLTQTAGMPNAVLFGLEHRHILKAEMRADSRWYELQHDRLIQPLQQGGTPPPARPVPSPRPDPAALLRAAEVAMADGDLSVARRHADEALRACGNSDLQTRAECESFLGNVALQSGELKAAEKHYRASAELFEMLQNTPAVGRLLAAIGQLLIARGNPRKAVAELRSAVARVPNDLTVQTELGVALWHSGHPSAATAVLDSVLSSDGGRREALRTRGEILADLGDARGALRDLNRVGRRLTPASLAARALAFASAGDFERTTEDLDRALAEAPANSSVLFYAARVHALRGLTSEAAELARRALRSAEPRLPAHQRRQAQSLAGSTADPDE